MKETISLVLFFLIAVSIACAENLELNDETDRISYSVGHQIGTDFKRQGVALNEAAMLRGVIDGMGTETSQLMTEQEMSTTLIALKKKIEADAQKSKNEQVVQNLEEGQKFLEENAQKEGVKVLDNGLQYLVLEKGSGKSPKETDTVVAHYKTTLLDGTVMGSSVETGTPRKFKVTNTIPGMKQALLMMHEGDKWRVFIPSDLAFGSNTSSPMAGKVLIFEAELLEVKQQ